MNTVIYTAITDGKDGLKPAPVNAGASELVAFMDWQPLHNGNWDIRKAWDFEKSANRNAKIHKVMPHYWFPHAEYSLWIDGSVIVKPDFKLKPFIEYHLAEHDIAVFKHPIRDCAYQEGVECLKLQLDETYTIASQMDRYNREGYPHNNGLAECTIILRRHSKLIENFNELWWEEIKKGSHRDQLSFNYCLDRVGLSVKYFEGSVQTLPALYPNMVGNAWFEYVGH